MHSLFLEKKWEALNAKFSQIGGHQCVESVSDPAEESRLLRSCVCLSDLSFAKKYVFEESAGMDFLDTVLAGNILKLRYGRIADTFLADGGGSFAAECFVADIDDKLILLAENACRGDFLSDVFSAGNCRDVSGEYVLLCADGPHARKVAIDVFGPDVLNLPYLSAERYDFDGREAYLFRNGKTGEFGYQFMVPNETAESFFDKISASVLACGGGFCGTKTQFLSRLEGGFFNAYEEGVRVKSPITLGLQWQIDFSKDSFSGSAEIFKDRINADLPRLICLKSPADSPAFAIGEKIFAGKSRVGEVVSCAYSHALGAHLALALFDRGYAHSGFEFSRQDGGICHSVSRPAVLAESLYATSDSE